MNARQALVKLHLFGAALAGVFLVILGLTGSIMAFEEELDHATHSRLFKVSPQGTPLSLAELTSRVRAAYPGKPVVTYGIGVSPDLSWSVNVGGTIVFVNEYTGEILGTRTGPTWLGQIHQVHLRLLSGDTGKTIVSWAGVFMLLLSLSGIVLWWPIKRITINRAAQGRRFWFDIHNAVGVCAFLFVFLMAVTGVVIGFDTWSTPLLYRVSGSQPVRGASASTPVPGARVLTPDEALAIARRELPGAAAVGINVPGPKTSYRSRFQIPGGPHARRPQPGLRQPVRRLGAAGRERADDGRGHAAGDPESRDPHRRPLRPADQGADVAGQPRGRGPSRHWTDDVVAAYGMMAP